MSFDNGADSADDMASSSALIDPSWKENRLLSGLLLFDSWRLDECLTCFRRISASGTKRDAGSNAGIAKSRGTSWEMIDSSCVPIVAC